MSSAYSDSNSTQVQFLPIEEHRAKHQSINFWLEIQIRIGKRLSSDKLQIATCNYMSILSGLGRRQSLKLFVTNSVLINLTYIKIRKDQSKVYLKSSNEKWINKISKQIYITFILYHYVPVTCTWHARLYTTLLLLNPSLQDGYVI